MVSQGQSRFCRGRLPVFLILRGFEGVPPPDLARVDFVIGWRIYLNPTDDICESCLVFQASYLPYPRGCKQRLPRFVPGIPAAAVAVAVAVAVAAAAAAVAVTVAVVVAVAVAVAAAAAAADAVAVAGAD